MNLDLLIGGFVVFALDLYISYTIMHELNIFFDLQLTKKRKWNFTWLIFSKIMLLILCCCAVQRLLSHSAQ